jgi:hypothetical protein
MLAIEENTDEEMSNNLPRTGVKAVKLRREDYSSGSEFDDPLHHTSIEERIKKRRRKAAIHGLSASSASEDDSTKAGFCICGKPLEEKVFIRLTVD